MAFRFSYLWNSVIRRSLTLRNLVVFYVTGICTILVLVNRTPRCPQNAQSVERYGMSNSMRNDLMLFESRLHEWEIRLKALESSLRAGERQLRRNGAQLPNSIVSKLVDESLDEDVATIYIITPTYTRLTQKADLTRLLNTLLNVRRIRWILVEDALEISQLVSNLLRNSGIVYTHLAVPTPLEHRNDGSNPRWYRPRGVAQRNAGLKWVRNEALEPGVVYFADDDNAYSLRLFDEMRATRSVSVWPVGLVGNLRFEKPIVSHNGRVTGWFTYWKPKRPYATDMAGFAVSVRLLRDRAGAEFSYKSGRGEQESDFISKLIDRLEDLEPRATNCSEVLVWHTRTEPANVTNEVKLQKRGLQGTDPRIEV